MGSDKPDVSVRFVDWSDKGKPEDLLAEVTRRAHKTVCKRLYPEPPCDMDKSLDCYALHKAITRAIEVAQKVGEIRAYADAAKMFDHKYPLSGCCSEMCYCDSPNRAAADVMNEERARLLRELADA